MEALYVRLLVRYMMRATTLLAQGRPDTKATARDTYSNVGIPPHHGGILHHRCLNPLRRLGNGRLHDCDCFVRCKASGVKLRMREM